MKANNLIESLNKILNEDPRYTLDAYHFLRESLDFTSKMLDKPKTGISRHVSGAELLDGIRKYALQEYGPMAKTVLNTFGITKSEDFWHIISNLINMGILGCTPDDSIHDFENGYSFAEAFIAPFKPGKAEKHSSKT